MQPIRLAHEQVQEQNVRRQITNELHRFRPVGCLTNYLDVGMGFKQFLQAFTEQCVFISYQDAQRSLDILRVIVTKYMGCHLLAPPPWWQPLARHIPPSMVRRHRGLRGKPSREWNFRHLFCSTRLPTAAQMALT